MATKALIVDEATGVRTLFARILRSLACVTIEASDGGQAVEALEQEEIDLAILALDTPVVSGLELLQALRTSERYQGIPVVMITDGADQATVAEVVRLGASDCLTKPFEVEVLRAHLQRTVRNVSAMASHQAAPPTSSSASGTALIVDQNAEFRHFVANVLMNNYATLQAENGLEALRLCEVRRPTVLVLGDNTGLLAPRLVARRLRRNSALDDMRIVLVAPKDGARDVVDPNAFDAVLTRTFVPAEFAQQFQQVFARCETGEGGVIADVRKTVVSATEQALGMMASTDMTLADDDGSLPPAALEAFTVMKLQMERVLVRLTLRCDEATARRLAARMMGAEEGDVSAEDGLSGLGEMVNVIAGRVKSAVTGEGGSMSFSLPELHPVAADAPPPQADVTLPFVSAGKDVALGVFLTLENSAAAAA
jgi:two-component system chemotaxis response regulator CheY